MGLTSYYRKFVKDYGQIVAPLTALLKNSFVWSDLVAQAFQQLKLAIFNPQVLALLDFSKTFTVECDASLFGLDAILMQDPKPIAFYSQVLKGSSLALSTYEKEFLAVVVAIQKWRHYLVGKPFVIKTYQQSHKYLLDQRVGTLAQQRWIMKLLGYTFLVDYKKGKENVVANALSRQREESMDVSTTNLFSVEGVDLFPTEGTLFIISFSTPT